MRMRTAVVAAALTVVAACGGADAATSTSTATAAPATSPAPSSTQSVPPSPSTAPTTTVDPVAAEFGAVSISGAFLPESGQERDGTDIALGLVAPDVTGSSRDGTVVTIGGGVGPQAILFAAHWCSHCTAEVPRVADWLAATGGVEGVDIVLVTVGVDPNLPNWPPSEWLANAGWDHPVMRDDEANTAFRAYGGAQIPYWVILDADGEVVERIVGATEIPQLESALQAVG